MVLVDFVSILVFPGLVLIIYLAIMASWLFRKLVARMENRMGPPFNQPVFDIAKLMAKERVYPENSSIWVSKLLPRLQVATALFMSLMIPIVGDEGVISFDGDVFAFLALLAIHGSTAFFVGWASNNPYSTNGAGRAVLTEISLELPLGLTLASLAIMTGTMRISEMAQSIGGLASVSNWPYLIPYLLLLGVMLYSILGALELNPFSAAHAETEIVGGWNTELTGSDLAMTKLADLLNLLNLSGLTVALFFGGPSVVEFNSEMWIAGAATVVIGLSTFIFKTTVVVFLLAFLSTTSSRLRIDQVTTVMWRYMLPLSLIGMFLVMLAKAFGGTNL